MKRIIFFAERNPFPSVCGRVCHDPCEVVCNRGEIDEPVAINNLKRYNADWVRQKRQEEEYKAEKAAIDPAKPKIGIAAEALPDLPVRGILLLTGIRSPSLKRRISLAEQ